MIFSSAGGLAVPAFAALAAACAFGVAAALQHQQAGKAPERRGLSWRLMADVIRRPLWLAGLAVAAAAYGLQAIALAYGPLTLVAPIVAADLLFALPLAARWSRRPLRPRDWGGCLLVAAGVAAFLAVAPPGAGRSDVPRGAWILAFGVVITVAVVAVAIGKVAGRRVRAGLLAAAAGLVFGLTAAVTASFTRSLRHEGIGSLAAHWQPWALITLGIAGVVLSTSAFQASALSASLPIIDTVEPVSGVVIGAFLFDERVASSPGGLAVQLAAAAVAIAGIAMLGPSLAAVAGKPAPAPGAAAEAEGAAKAPARAADPAFTVAWRAELAAASPAPPAALVPAARAAAARASPAAPARGGGRPRRYRLRDRRPGDDLPGSRSRSPECGSEAHDQSCDDDLRPASCQ